MMFILWEFMHVCVGGSSSTLWVLWGELKLSGLSANTFTHGPLTNHSFLSQHRDLMLSLKPKVQDWMHGRIALRAGQCWLGPGV